jgi:DNA-binding NtrC family response regulator
MNSRRFPRSLRMGIIVAVVFPMGKILLLEDDPQYREIIKRVLSLCYPYLIRSVPTEMQAWEELSSEDFDLVLLDLYIDGRRCWETLKRVVSLPGKPIAIVLSCEDTRMNADIAVSLGAYAFLSKPVDFIRLKMTIDSAFRAEKRDTWSTSETPGEGPPSLGVS